VRDKDESDNDAEKESRRVRGPLSHASEVLAPLSLFVSVYLATFVAFGLLFRLHIQWAGLAGAIVATLATIRIWERGRWAIGLRTSPGNALRELTFGAALATVLIGVCSVLIVLTTDLRQSFRGGFPTADLLLLFAPAALHEELAFRGYVFQKLRQWSRWGAIAISSAVFALMHGGNAGVSVLGIVNIVIAGVLLALAYERYRRLWFPIGIHFAWNLMSGPILGYPVSGFVPQDSVLAVIGTGPALQTGGAFGIEGSVFMTVVEIAGIAILLKMQKAE
jgi:membrane protease YdiL (CAAX protease family)